MTYVFWVFVAVAIGSAIYITLAPKLPNMHEGIWEISTETRMPGAQMSITNKHSQCLTKEECIPTVSLPKYRCRPVRPRYGYHIIGNYVWVRVQCEGVIIIQGNGYVKYKGDSLRGKIQMRTIGNNGQKRFNFYISGFRTGDCDKGG